MHLEDEAAAKTMLLALADWAVPEVLRASTLKELLERLRAVWQARLTKKAEQAVNAPGLLVLEEDRRSFKGAAREVGGAIASGKPAAKLAQVRPELTSGFAAASETAAKDALQSEKTVKTFGDKLEDALDARKRVSATVEDTRALELGIRRAERVARGAVALDVPIIVVALATFLGIPGMQLHRVPISLWVVLFGLTVATLVALHGLGMAGAYFLDRLGVARERLVTTGGAVTLVMTVLFVAALTLLRFGASELASRFSADAVVAGSIAIVILTGVANLVLIAAIVGGRYFAADQAKRLAAALRRLAPYEKEVKDLGDRLAGAHGAEASARAEAAVIGDLERAFESESQAVATLIRDEVAAFEATSSQASAAWRVYYALPPVSRALIADELIRLIPPGEKPGAEVAKRVGGGLLALVLSGALTACSGCEDRPPVRVVICDPTGKYAACDAGFRRANADDWLRAHAGEPGGRYDIITTGGSFASTEVAASIVVPEITGEQVLQVRERWIADARAEVERVQPPADADYRGKANRSDLPSALTLAGHLSSEGSPLARRELVMASDGLAISDGINFEREIPSVRDVIARLRASGNLPDLSRFERVVLCGQGPEVPSARVFEARKRFWREFIPAVGGPPPEIQLSCAGAEVRSGSPASGQVQGK